MEKHTHRTTVRFNCLGKELLAYIKSVTHLSTKHVVENALAVYADRLRRHAQRNDAPARPEEGNPHA